MKKYLLPLLLLAGPAFAAQQEITAVPASPANPSIGSLKDAINLRLADIDENFDEIYPILSAGPVYVNTTAPADTKVVWIDTDQDNAIKVYVGGVWAVVGSGGEGSYTLPVATGTTLGGVKAGLRVSINEEGYLSADLQPPVFGNCTTAPCYDGSSDGGSSLRYNSIGTNFYTEVGSGTLAANRQWKFPVAAAPTAGETLVMTMDEYGQMGFLAAPETSGYVLSSTDAGVLSWVAGGSAGDNLGSASYSDVVALWPTCTGYLKSDGTCDTPSGSATYPSAAGVANWNGSAWGTSYTVGTAANNLVQLNGSAQLPAVSGALLTNIPLPTWLPTAAPTADNMIIQAAGGCSNIAYTDQAACEANSGTWTPPVGAWTSIIDGLINDAGTGTDDLLSASEIDTRISSAGAFYQAADGDLDTAAGASAAGNSKLFGTNSSGVVGWYDIPTGGTQPVAMQQVFASSTTLVAGTGSKTKAITGVGWTTADIGCDSSDTLVVSVKTSSAINGIYTEVGTVSLTASAQNTAVNISSWADISAGTWVRIDLTGTPAAATECTIVIEGVEQ